MKRVLDGASMFYVGLFFVVILLGGVHIYYYYCYYYCYWTDVALLIVVDAKGAPHKVIELEVTTDLNNDGLFKEKSEQHLDFLSIPCRGRKCQNV